MPGINSCHIEADTYLNSLCSQKSVCPQILRKSNCELQTLVPASLHFMSSDDLLSRWRMAPDDVPQLTNNDPGRPIEGIDGESLPRFCCVVHSGTKHGEPFLIWKFEECEKHHLAEILDGYVRLAPHPAIPNFVGYYENGDLSFVTEGDYSRICDTVFQQLDQTQLPPEFDATRKAKAIFGVVAALVHMEAHGMRPYLNLQENIMFNRNWDVKVAYTFKDVRFQPFTCSIPATLWRQVCSYGWGYSLVWFMSLLLGFNPEPDTRVVNARALQFLPTNRHVRLRSVIPNVQFNVPPSVNPLLRSIVQSIDKIRCDHGLDIVPYTGMEIFQALLRLKEPLFEGVDMHEYDSYKSLLVQQTSGAFSLNIDRHFIGGADPELCLDPNSEWGAEMERFMKIKYVMEKVSDDVRRRLLQELQCDLNAEHPNVVQATALLAYGFSIAGDNVMRAREIGARTSHSTSHVVQYLSCFCGFDSKVEEDRREIIARIENHVGSGNPFCMRVAATLALGINIREFPFQKCYQLSVLPLAGARTDDHLADLVADDPRYIFVQRVGEGRFGKVDWVIDRETFTSYALKKFRLGSVDDCPSFQRELENLHAVDHPCVIAIRGIILPVGRSKPKILMDFMSDGTLDKQLELWRREVSINPYDVYFKMTLTICRVALGLERLHGRALIHRDLKPSNILFASHEDGPMAVIGDLGSGRNATGSTLTHNAGTFRYKAPELYEQAEYNEKIDIFSFALIAYEILALEPFFDPALSEAQIMRQATNGYHPDLSTKAAFRRVSPFMWKIIQDGWSTDPRARPTARSIVFTLERNDYKVFDCLPSHYHQCIQEHMRKLTRPL